MQLMCGDCLELMKSIPDGSIDMILTDPPYGTTDAPWDKVVPIDEMWEEYNRIIKQDGAVVLFSQLPFAVDLINGNRKSFRYEIIWQKTMTVGFLNANKMPLRAHENILIFYKKLPTYNPQKTAGKPYFKPGSVTTPGEVYGNSKAASKRLTIDNVTGERYPTDVLRFSNAGRRGKKHSTQKPTALLEWLIKTYTNPGEVVLDSCMGSGSTGVACVNTGRDFIGIELNEQFFNIAKERIAEAQGIVA